GVGEELIRISKLTGGRVIYLGEWHSHPPNCSTSMSTRDEILLSQIADFQAAEGFPALMLIVGDSGVQVYLQEALDD
ncbi:MAG TPA: hypothetical protein DEA96_14270, partial [Leptospiraceae bacterium]|nr:hypothetical protein [Leptospiraceae bacterium]